MQERDADAVRAAEPVSERQEKKQPLKYLSAEELERRRCRERWNAPGRAVVSHPQYYAVIVPCASPLAALHCAAEIWGCTWLDVTDAKVRWAPENAPVTYPKKMPPV